MHEVPSILSRCQEYKLVISNECETQPERITRVAIAHKSNHQLLDYDTQDIFLWMPTEHDNYNYDKKIK